MASSTVENVSDQVRTDGREDRSTLRKLESASQDTASLTNRSNCGDDGGNCTLRLASPGDGVSKEYGVQRSDGTDRSGVNQSQKRQREESYERHEPDSQEPIGGVHDHHGTGVSNPASDEDPGVVDEKRQKRMLSNRESARRSRLRKQHHLDEMKQQVAQLRAENTDMVTKYNLASRHYAQITDENRVLRSHAMELSRRLQRLHHAATAQGHTMGHEFMGMGHMDPSLQLGMGGMPSGGGMPHGQHHAMAHMPQMAHHVAGAHPSAFHYQFPGSMTPELTR